MSSTEGLQIAQIIADLQTLQNAVRPLFPSSSPPHFSPPPSTSPPTPTHLSCHSPSPSSPPSLLPSSPLSSLPSSFLSLFSPPPHRKQPLTSNTPPHPQDPHAALSLLKPLNTAISSSSPQARRNSAPKFDKLGRRIVSISRSQSNAGGVKTPTFGREGSSASTGSMNMGMTAGGGSGASTPENSSTGAELDEDLIRAKTLLQLFEMRGKFKQMGDTGLSRAKQRVDDVIARYAKAELEEREKVARARYLGV
ncbi:hypothetical protein DL98DRAFT_516488 [Cadophora sp. DSE1049]|nr:hypothetical protein DL98DRAFT_516488 [Cadophora sp. DSE1049]